LISWLAAKFNPEIEVGLVGAIESQAKKAYSYIKKWAKQYSDCKSSFMSQTEFVNGSIIQILSGTINGMNSPHPALAVLDEFELTTPEKYTEFENILHSSPDYDAVEILTTSIKYPNGMAVKTMEDAGYAFKQEGVVQIVQNPTRKLYLWTTLDTAEPCQLPDCSYCKTLVKDGRSFMMFVKGDSKELKALLKLVIYNANF